MREKLEEIKFSELPDILKGIAFVFFFQRGSLEASTKQLLADINGDNLFELLKEKSRKSATVAG